MHKKKLIKYLICPKCKSKKIKKFNSKIICLSCNDKYPIIYEIPILITKKKCRELNLSYHKKNFKKKVLNNNFKLNKFGIIENLNDVIMSTSGLLYYKSKNIKNYPIPEIPFPKLIKNKNKNKSLLDIGCGWGRWSINAANKGYEVIGIDISIENLILAKKISESFKLKNCNFICCDVLDLPLKENTFDQVFSFSFLQHFSQNKLEIILKNISNKMKSKSIFKTQMVNKFALRSIYNIFKIKFTKQKVLNDFDVRYFSIQKINRIFSKYFKVKNFENYSFFTQAPISDYNILSLKSKLFLNISKIFNLISLYLKFFKYVSDNCLFTLEKKIH